MFIYVLMVFYWGQNYDFLGEPFNNKAQCEYYASYKNTFNKPSGVREFKCIEFKEKEQTNETK